MALTDFDVWWVPEFVRLGGWVMVALLACSVFAVAVTVERLFALRRSAVVPRRVLDAIQRLASPADVENLAREGESLGASPLARVARVALANRGLPRELNEEATFSAGRAAAKRLERGLGWIEIVAATAPLLGLLGTVLGMVEVFGSFPFEAETLPAGIHKALYTTVAGLTLGIPMLAVFVGYNRRVEGLSLEMEEAAMRMLNRIYGTRGEDG